jgi:acetylornithine deacetylase
MQKTSTSIKQEALDLLRSLISTPSFSKEEDATAAIIVSFLEKQGIKTYHSANNVYAIGINFNKEKPSLLLNSHHDTVKPNPQYTRNPFEAITEDGKLYGLGSNDAGGPLVSLIAVFCLLQADTELPWNLVLAATAEEEISGKGGIEALLQDKEFITHTAGCFQPENLHPLTCAIVGEPTRMQMAVAERGLMVLDVLVKGRPGHAAREEGDNAIYKSLEVIDWFRHYQFTKVSSLLGANKMSVTVIETENKAHNVVPAECRMVIDTRINELYSFDEVLQEIRTALGEKILLEPRSTRLKSSMIATDHPLVKSGLALALTHYGSPTTSDKALMPFPALKMGPGDSARSHSANEWIGIEEIEKGIDLYCKLIKLMQG